MSFQRRPVIWGTAGAGSLLVLTILFQNCSPQNFAEIDSTYLGSKEIGYISTETYTSGGDVNAPATPSVGIPSTPSAGSSSSSNSGSSNSSSTASNSNSSAGSSSSSSTSSNTSSNSSSSAAVAEVNCSVDMQQLGWTALSEDVQATVNPIDAYTSGAQGYPQYINAYDGVAVSFEAPYLGNSKTYSRSGINYAASGYSIRITGQTGATVVASSLDIGRFSGVTYSGYARGIAAARDGANRIAFGMNRAFYNKIQNFGRSTVSLLCNNRVVAKGVQDISSLKWDMQKTMLRSSYAHNGIPGYTTDPKSPSGFVNITCPLEAAKGSTVQCSVGGLYVVSGSWYINGEEVKAFSGASSDKLVVNNAGAGNYIVQVVAKYNDGRQDVTALALVKIK